MITSEIELDTAPKFELGEKVRLCKMIRNDGTFPGEDRGAILAHEGEIGYVISVGTYLQQYYVYSVHFLAIGKVIGCLKRELESLDQTDSQASSEVSEFAFMQGR